MAFRIEVKHKIPDSRSRVKLGYFNSLGLSSRVKAVEILDAYSVDAGLSPKQLREAGRLLANPLIETFQVHPAQKNDGKNSAGGRWDWAVEIAFLPGVTDNIGATARETLSDGLKVKFKPDQGVYSSQVFFISGKLSESDIQKIAGSLFNPLIQKANIKTFKDYQKNRGFGPNLPKVKLKQKIAVLKINLNQPDQNLADLGRLGIFDPKTKSRRGPLALDLDQLKVIRNYFYKLRRQPTDVELESLAQTWSEHCKHTIFSDPLDEISDGIYRHYIKRATNLIRQRLGKNDFCVSVFADNSGGIIFDDNYLITHKVETHNTPSALDPFGGSLTGIVGVNRDALGFGLGAKPVINTYGFCLAKPDDKTELFRDAQKNQPMLSARRIMDGVVAGVNAGGNQSGIPTNSGFLYFDPKYRGKPLVFAGTVGLIPRKIRGRPGHIKFARPGDLIVIVGGRTGLDGIHGATFSSESLSKDSPATAVQIGDPITQKKFSDALIREARGQGLYSSITDDGGGGLSSSVGEMAQTVGGCEVDLRKVPTKYPGLLPWQIWISESQERMTLAVPQSKWLRLQNLLKRRGVEAAVIGRFTNSGKCVVKYNTQTVMDMDLEFLHEGRPVRFQQSRAERKAQSEKLKTKLQNNKQNFKSLILNLLSSPNLASAEFVSMQYDHEVQGSSVTKPLQGLGRIAAEATVTRPVLQSKKGVVLAYGLNPSFSDFDPYHMAACAIDSAVRAAVCAGANLNHLALLDNFCWPSGSSEESLYQLKLAAKACFDCATAYNAPFISGKDSMFNDFTGFSAKGARLPAGQGSSFSENSEPIKISVPPTLLISAISVINDVSKAVTLDLKLPGDAIFVLGETKNELGGSEYHKMLYDKSQTMSQDGAIPKVNAQKNLKLYQALQAAIQQNLVASAISIGRGGLAAALAKTAIAGQLGVKINLQKIPTSLKNSAVLLFSESQGRILVSVAPKKIKAFQKLLRGNKFAQIGQVTEDGTITIAIGNKVPEVEIKLAEATKAYKSTFKNF